MGAVRSFMDIELAEILHKVLSISALIEITPNICLHRYSHYRLFDIVYAISNKNTDSDAQDSIVPLGLPVHRVFGDPAENIESISKVHQGQGIVYWLNIQKDESPAISEMGQYNLIHLLRSIGPSIADDSVIAIDNAHAITCSTVYSTMLPGFQDILDQLIGMSSRHEIIILDDALIFYPKKISSHIKLYTINRGNNWGKGYEQLKNDLVKLRQNKEAVVENLSKELDKRQSAELLLRLISKGPLGLILWPAFRILLFFSMQLQPRIGRLTQHRARQMNLQYGPAINRKIDASKAESTDPLVSIVTPSYNQGQYVEETINSVIKQSYKNIEHIVQDNCSTDDTRYILQQYSDFISAYQESDTGQSNALNKGFQRTSGHIMAWLNSDDLLMPDTVEKVVDYFNDHPEVDVVYGNRITIDRNGHKIGRWVLPEHDREAIKWVDYIPQETMFWRRSIWEKSGGYIDEGFNFAMDWELILRFESVSANIKNIPYYLGQFRVHSVQKTSSNIESDGMFEMDKLRKHTLGFVPDPDTVRKNVRGYLVRHCLADKRSSLKSFFDSICQLIHDKRRALFKNQELVSPNKNSRIKSPLFDE